MSRGRYSVTGKRRIIAVTKVFGRGKTQIPSEVRKLLDLRDGDRVVWLLDLSEREVLVKNADDVA